MTDVVVRLPTWQRYRTVRREIGKHSLLRCLEYERLSQLGLEGRVLDFGGGRRTNYSSRIEQWGRDGAGYVYESANIDPATEPTYLLDASGRIPAEDGSYDAILSLNTLEHVRDLETALSELRRVSRTGGRLILVVPFLFRVHGHPDDYHRGTPSFWEGALRRHGFDRAVVETLSWGPFSTGAMVSGLPGPLKGPRRTLGLLLDLAFAQKNHKGTERLSVAQDDPRGNAPIAYFIEAAAA